MVVLEPGRPEFRFSLSHETHWETRERQALSLSLTLPCRVVVRVDNDSQAYKVGLFAVFNLLSFWLFADQVSTLLPFDSISILCMKDV